MRVHNRFGGMGDLAYFDFEIPDANQKQERKAGFQKWAGARLRLFEGLGCGSREV